jgi:hypothetical protein
VGRWEDWHFGERDGDDDKYKLEFGELVFEFW